jgi:hypothetical protein
MRTADEVRALLAQAPFDTSLGLTETEIAATRPIYRFPSGEPGYRTGLSAYRTPLGAGFCISFAVGVSCSRTPPTPAEPLLGLALDPDAERADEPFVVISMTAPGVRSVTYTCAGSTYPATLTGGVAVFIAPDSSLSADDCIGNAVFSSGVVVSKQI